MRHNQGQRRGDIECLRIPLHRLCAINCSDWMPQPWNGLIGWLQNHEISAVLATTSLDFGKQVATLHMKKQLSTGREGWLINGQHWTENLSCLHEQHSYRSWQGDNSRRIWTKTVCRKYGQVVSIVTNYDPTTQLGDHCYCTKSEMCWESSYSETSNRLPSNIFLTLYQWPKYSLTTRMEWLLQYI